jgi:tryptophanase
MNNKYVVPPFKIKMVEPINLIDQKLRQEKLKDAGYNLFALKSEDVFIDLLTDSGTGAMSQYQWSAMMVGDESYAGSKSFFHLERVVKEITNYQYMIPAHQGRGAEQVVIPQLVKKPKMFFISNTHFDTTRAHVEIANARAIDVPTKECFDMGNYYPFKGNFDIEGLIDTIKEKGADHIAGIIMTLTNNSAGGQPVSMENIRNVSQIAKENNIKVIIDGARYAENAYFIKIREKGYENKSMMEIVHEMFSYADIFLMSAKKDGLVNIGGLIVIKDDRALYETCRTYIVPLEGFPTYGGLAGRDMEALAVGLKEALEEDYLKHRLDEVRYLGDLLKEAGIPIQYPTGGHAVFVDCKKMCPHIPFDQFPAQAVANALYLEGGIRAVEIGSFLLGRDPDTKENLESKMELMRLTIPRRTYTYQHLAYVAQCLIQVYQKRMHLKGYQFVYEPHVLRHFTAILKPME